MTVGERIKKRRTELHKSADEVAESLGKNRATIYRYESNDIENLPAKVLAPLADVLETTPAYLMGWTDDPYDYDRDPNSILSEIPTEWARAWEEEGISNAEIWKRYSSINEDSLRENKKVPDTLIDVEDLSEDKRYLVKRIIALPDETVHRVRTIVDQVLDIRGD